MKTIIKRSFFSFSYRFFFVSFSDPFKNNRFKTFLKKDSFWNDQKTKQKTIGKRKKQSFFKKMKTLTSLILIASIVRYKKCSWTRRTRKYYSERRVPHKVILHSQGNRKQLRCQHLLSLRESMQNACRIFSGLGQVNEYGFTPFASGGCQSLLQ